MSLLAQPTLRQHPTIGSIFRAAEARHFNDSELQSIVEAFPETARLAETCKSIRGKDIAIIGQVIKTIFSMYDYDAHHDFATAKCTRDVRYVVQYSCASMMANDPQWLLDKLLIWLKTILQAFDFPARKAGTISTDPADADLEAALAALPKKSQSIYHTYFLLRKSMQQELTAEEFGHIEPYLTTSLNVLTEAY